MKRTQIVLIAAGCMLIALAACKKKDNGSPAQSNLIGTWTPTYEAKDKNANGVMDSTEVTAAALYQGHQLSFGTDGTMSILALNGQLAGEKNWVLTNNNTYLETTDKSTGANADYQHIDGLTAAALVLRDTTGGTITWYLFAKQ